MTLPAAATASVASAQLRRLLLALPKLADDRAHSISSIAELVGTDVPTFRRDLMTLVTRVTDDPGGFTEGVQLMLGADSVQLEAPSGHFRRPMALTRFELHALELGLAALEQESPPDARDVMHRARARLGKAIAKMPKDSGDDERSGRHVVMSAESDAQRELRRTLQHCIRARQVARITYQSASSCTASARTVQPLGIIWARGAWFLIAWCERSDGMRVFRTDRISAAACEERKFTPAEGFSLTSVLREGKVLVGGPNTTMRIRYSPRVARWIAEREKVVAENDGSVVAEYPLMDMEWGVLRVLRYGPDAEVLEPAELRTAVAERLKAMLSD